MRGEGITYLQGRVQGGPIVDQSDEGRGHIPTGRTVSWTNQMRGEGIYLQGRVQGVLAHSCAVSRASQLCLRGGGSRKPNSKESKESKEAPVKYAITILRSKSRVYLRNNKSS
eukprot:1004489-Pyramimonas_sp.AAC.1